MAQDKKPRLRVDLDPQGPLTFKRDVEIPTPDGASLTLPVVFKYRDREAVAALFDGYRAEADAEAAVPNRPVAESVRAAIESDVRTLRDLMDGWGLDYPFDDDHLRKLCVRYAGAAFAIVTDYRVSLTAGRLGN